MKEKIDKQAVEEMARAICESCATDSPCRIAQKGKMCAVVLKQGEVLYNAGYRKQSEGECDFCKADHEKCGTCVKFFDYYEDGDGNERCSAEYGNEKCAYYKPVHYCSNCGAKMKGGKG